MYNTLRVIDQCWTGPGTSEHIVGSTYETEKATTYIKDGEPVCDEGNWGGCHEARETEFCFGAYSGRKGRFALGNFNFGNPGGEKGGTKLNAVKEQMKNGKQHLWCLQEATRDVFKGLKNCEWIDGDKNRRSWAGYQAYMGNNPPCRHQILAVCHSEGDAQSGLMFCGRTTHVSCLELMFYEKHDDGQYNDGMSMRNAFTEFAVASYYMKRWQIGEQSAVADEYGNPDIAAVAPTPPPFVPPAGVCLPAPPGRATLQPVKAANPTTLPQQPQKNSCEQ